MSMKKFGVVKDLATGEIEKIYGHVRLEGDGWYISVEPNQTMTGFEIRCSGSMIGENEMIVRPRVGNAISVSSTASEHDKETEQPKPATG